jgi:myo-inositol-hexaphosphate 3-phosphohydrolase
MLYRLAMLVTLLILLLVGVPAAGAAPVATTHNQSATDPVDVPPQDETRPILDLDESPDGQRLGDADDPAIWIHPDKPSHSLVIAVLKNGGLDVYDLKGQVVQSIDSEPGKQTLRYNNVDLAYGFRLGSRKIDLAVASDRANDLLVFYKIDPDSGRLVNVTAPNLPRVFTQGDDAALAAQTTAYGLTLYKAPNDQLYAFVSQRSSNVVAQLRLYRKGDRVAWERVRTLTFPLVGGVQEESQVEGMVVDQELGYLYAGQEKFGIWKFDASPRGNTEGTIVDRVAPDGPNLQADVEGLTIYYAGGKKGYLLVSSQGDNTFAVYDRRSNDYLGSFRIGSRGKIDSVEESDGADVVNVSLGDRYPQGLLVVQDGQNDPPFLVEDNGEFENVNTNFKFVRWDKLAKAFPDRLLIDTKSYDPRDD